MFVVLICCRDCKYYLDGMCTNKDSKRIDVEENDYCDLFSLAIPETTYSVSTTSATSATIDTYTEVNYDTDE